MTDYTPYQQRIIKNYYNNRQALALQKLNELVADLYLAATDKERDRLWKKVAGALANLNVPPQISDHILLKRSPEILAANLKDWWDKMPRDKPPKPPRG